MSLLQVGAAVDTLRRTYFCGSASLLQLHCAANTLRRTCIAHYALPQCFSAVCVYLLVPCALESAVACLYRKWKLR